LEKGRRFAEEEDIESTIEERNSHTTMCDSLGSEIVAEETVAVAVEETLGRSHACWDSLKVSSVSCRRNTHDLHLSGS